MSGGMNMENVARKIERTYHEEPAKPDLRLVPPLPGIRMADLDYSSAPTVRGIGYRFVIPVPDLGRENQRLFVKNWKGENEFVVGFGFRNEVDGAMQAVAGDGTGVLLIALNPDKVYVPATAKAILEKVQELTTSGPLNVAKLNQMMWFLTQQLGLTDIYNSTDATVQAMKPQAGLVYPIARPFGLFQKQEKPGPVAVFVEGGFSVLDGPHAGSATYPNGFMAVRIPPKSDGEVPSYRSVAPAAISYCYELADGGKLTDPGKQLPVIAAPR